MYLIQKPTRNSNMTTKVVVKQVTNECKLMYSQLDTGTFFTIKSVPGSIYLKAETGVVIVASERACEIGRKPYISEDGEVRRINVVELEYSYET